MNRDIMVVKLFEGTSDEEASRIKQLFNEEYGEKWFIVLSKVLKDCDFKFEFIQPSTFVSTACNK